MNAQNYKEQSQTDSNGYQYTTVSNDKNGVRVYTLKNGLNVYLAQNFDAPKIQTYIPVRIGSNNDPSDNTGLAHYLEHMMFKGTSHLASDNWIKEKPLLDKISDLYEQHKAETDPDKKKEIYHQIDAVSQEASKYAIANEYDKVISSLGATGTNAHTWLDETVYKNNIPSNELEKWLKIEKERFSELTLRLFHTELEAVYEEFNRAQDNDGRLVNYELMRALFPKHPNGQQTTLGSAEHLKNPSMVAIHQYFDTYYVPNNYAMVLVGDLDFDKTIKMVDQYFGTFNYKELPMKKMVSEEPMTEIVQKIVKSPSTPRLQMAWRIDSYGTIEARLAEIVAHILSNNAEAGLIDLHLNQQQKLLRAGAFAMPFKTYGYFSLSAVPKENQTLEEAKKLLLDQLNLIKKGEFPDWILPAIRNDFKLQHMKTLETADGLATSLYDAYIKKRSWEQELNELNEFDKIDKNDVVEFANQFFKDNYAIIYKEKGVNEKLVRVENPGITPIKLNRTAQSEFLTKIFATTSSELKPQYIDYQKEIGVHYMDDKKVSFVKNKYNDIAQVHYIFPFGLDHDPSLGLSTEVLQYLGTKKYSPEDLKNEFFKIGISNDFRTDSKQLIITLSGLEENLPKGIALLQHWLNEVKPDENIYKNTIQTILERREVSKKDKSRIMAALLNYAKYGKDSRMTDVLSKTQLEGMKVEQLTNKIKHLFDYPYEIFFYGKDQANFEKTQKQFLKKTTLVVPEAKIYPEPSTDGHVYFTNYDMVQMEMSKIGKGPQVNIHNFGKVNVFNEYFGRGLSSIVFQEIRESRSLAYSASVSYSANSELNHPDYVSTYIGTQANKLPQAVEAMTELMENLPQIPAQFDNAKNAALKQIASGRITRTNVFFNTLNLKKLGLAYDFRKNIYEEIEKLSLQDITTFYNTEIKPIKYNTAIIGKKENMDMKSIEKMGDFLEMSLEDIFGY